MFAVGSQIGKYSLRRKLGQGGFGAVFAAYDESLEREVALKILNAEHKASDDVMRRFLQEARLAARIGHPGIVTVFECAQVQHTGTNADGIAYIAMELLDGESLAHRLHRCGRMSAPTAMEVTRQIASALEAAHKNGIVHRDLKPDNIFLVKDPAVMHGERVKVLDFGIAKLHHVQSSGVQTQTNEVFGTPRYMSPEQCRSSTQIDQRSDIYTLGCILFELLTGRPPFVGQTGELFAQHLMVDAPSVLSLVRETPYHVADLVHRMLAKEVDARPPTMADVQRELEAGGAVTVGVPATLPPGVSGQMPPENDSTLKAAAGVSIRSTDPRVRPPRAVIAAAAGIAILLAVALVLWLRGSGGGSGGDDKDARVAANTSEPKAPSKVTPIEAPKPEAPTPGAPKPAAEAPRESKSADASRASKSADAPRASKSADAPRESKSADAPRESKSSRESARDARREAKARPRDTQTTDAKVEPEPTVDKKHDPKQKTVNPFEAQTGVLQLRSSPACEILVDGKAIAATTPQELKLPAGKHRITLVHDELGIQEAFSVEIRAGATERVNRDLNEKIKAKKRNATINPFGGGN